MYIITGYRVMLWVTMTSVPTADSEWRIEMLHLNDTLKRFCMASAAPGAPAVATASTKWPSSVDNAKDLADLNQTGCDVPPNQISGSTPP